MNLLRVAEVLGSIPSVMFVRLVAMRFVWWENI